MASQNQLSNKEKQKEKELNKLLKPYGLSLSNTFDDVYNCYKKPKNKVQPISLMFINDNGRPSPFREYVEKRMTNSPLAGTSEFKPLLDTTVKGLLTQHNNHFFRLAQIAYNDKILGNNCSLSSHQLYLSTEDANPLHAVNPAGLPEHLCRCLQAIASGIDLAVYIAELIKGTEGKKAKTKLKGNMAAPATFDGLFLSPYNTPKAIESFVNVLREVEPPLINDGNGYIGKYKTAFVIWINKLKGEVIQPASDKTYASLLNSKFPGLNMGEDAGMFRKYNKYSSTHNEYKKDLSALISSVKSKYRIK